MLRKGLNNRYTFNEHYYIIIPFNIVVAGKFTTVNSSVPLISTTVASTTLISAVLIRAISINKITL
jgi:hypothetical protein